MRPVRALVPVVFAGLLASAALVGGGAPPDVTVHAVAGNVSYLEGRGGNIGVQVGDDGVLLIDDQFLQAAGDIERAVATLSDAKPRFLVNTHWHGDHTGGNPHFGTFATIVAHENVRRRLAGDDAIEGRKNDPPAPAAALPVITYADGIGLHFNGEEIRVIHQPKAHTDGDSVVWFTGSGVIHMGDLYFSAAFPFIDQGSGGSVRGVAAAIERVLALVPEDTHVIAGHGPATDTAGLRRYHGMLTTVLERVEAALAAGQDADEMKAAGLIDDLAATWEPQRAFVDRGRMIDTVARELSGE